MNESFVNYVLSFYGAGGVYEDFFSPPPTKEEVEAAVKIRQEASGEPEFSGDSFDRELVRDIMFAKRGKTTGLEYPVVLGWIAKS